MNSFVDPARYGLLAALFLCSAALPALAGESASVPLEIDDGRPVVEIDLRGPDGQQSTGRFLVDTGGGAFIIPEATARAARITWSETMQSQGRELATPDAIPRAWMAGLELPLSPDRVLIAVDQDLGLLPGHVLAQHHVIFDYPGRSLTLAPPGTIQPRGTPVSMPVSQPWGFPRTEFRVDGETVGMLLDTGPPATILSESVLNRWAREHPEWHHQGGAFAEAAALERAGGHVLATLVAGRAVWAGFELEPVTLAAQRKGVFENYMSQMMTGPIVGALGSNVFLPFRLELDYLNELLYVSRPSTGTAD